MTDENRHGGEQLNKYRLVIMNDETFEELSSIRVSKPKIYLAIGGIFLGIAFLLWSLISLTPLKNLILGGDHNVRQSMVDISIQVDSLEKALADRDHYIENMRKVLTGDLENADNMVQVAPDELKETEHPSLKPAPQQEEQPDEKKDPKSLSKKQIDSILNINSGDEKFEIPQRGPAATPAMVNSATPNIKELHFYPPLKGYITAAFQPGKKHYGVDIAAPKGTPVKSSMDGVVVISDWTMNTGKIIGIQHSHNLISFYKHNSVLLKKVGSFVKAGEAVAIIGNTGELSDGPHLHFEIWHNRQPVNPTDYIIF